MNMFRLLRADEIDCRISQISKDGKWLDLLLYKDARCDMNILDETVGPFNWMREHSRENANCTVSIWDAEKQQWISKEDTGTESNTEAEKGLASDSFKRACTNWGIGRELYTAPFIWIPASRCDIKDGRKCYDKFEVLEISYTQDRKISTLSIGNSTKQTLVFTTSRENAEPPKLANEAPSVCAECGGEIKPWTRGDEVIMTAEEVSINAQKQYGKPLCLSCIKALKKHENAD